MPGNDSQKQTDVPCPIQEGNLETKEIFLTLNKSLFFKGLSGNGPTSSPYTVPPEDVALLKKVNQNYKLFIVNLVHGFVAFEGCRTLELER